MKFKNILAVLLCLAPIAALSGNNSKELFIFVNNIQRNIARVIDSSPIKMAFFEHGNPEKVWEGFWDEGFHKFQPSERSLRERNHFGCVDFSLPDGSITFHPSNNILPEYTINLYQPACIFSENDDEESYKRRIPIQNLNEEQIYSFFGERDLYSYASVNQYYKKSESYEDDRSKYPLKDEYKKKNFIKRLVTELKKDNECNLLQFTQGCESSQKPLPTCYYSDALVYHNGVLSLYNQDTTCKPHSLQIMYNHYQDPNVSLVVKNYSHYQEQVRAEFKQQLRNYLDGFHFFNKRQQPDYQAHSATQTSLSESFPSLNEDRPPSHSDDFDAPPSSLGLGDSEQYPTLLDAGVLDASRSVEDAIEEPSLDSSQHASSIPEPIEGIGLDAPQPQQLPFIPGLVPAPPTLETSQPQQPAIPVVSLQNPYIPYQTPITIGVLGVAFGCVGYRNGWYTQLFEFIKNSGGLGIGSYIKNMSFGLLRKPYSFSPNLRMPVGLSSSTRNSLILGGAGAALCALGYNLKDEKNPEAAKTKNNIARGFQGLGMLAIATSAVASEKDRAKYAMGLGSLALAYQFIS